MTSSPSRLSALDAGHHGSRSHRRHHHHRHTSKSPKPGSERSSGGERSEKTWGSKKVNRGHDDLFGPAHLQLTSQAVQESDGSFFESYTSLAWRQENKRLRAASEDDKDYDRPPPVEIQFATKPQLQKPSRKEFELLYIEVLYTIKHKIGTTSGGHSPYIQDLFQYAKEAFGVSPEDHARLLAKATEEKPPIVILNVTVIEASGLEAKDADGFSDPYCMLGIMPGPNADVDSGAGMSSDEEAGKTRSEKERLHHSNSSASKKFSLRKKTKNTVVRDMLPAKLIKTTQVKPNTLNPFRGESTLLEQF